MSDRNQVRAYALIVLSFLAACGGKSSDRGDRTSASGGADGSLGGNPDTISGDLGSENAGSNNVGTGGAADDQPGGAGGIGDESPGEGGDGGDGGPGSVALPGPPRVIAVTPKDKAPATDVATLVQLTFSESLDPATITNDSVQIKDQAGAFVAGTLSYHGVLVSFEPSARLNLLGQYTVNVTTAVTDAGGTPLAAPFSSMFTVRDGTWGKSESSLATGGPHFDGSLALASDGAQHALAVWSQSTGEAPGSSSVYAALYDEASGWAVPIKINTRAVNSRDAVVSMSPRGDAVVGWFEYDQGNNISTPQIRRYVGGTWDASSTQVNLPCQDRGTDGVYVTPEGLAVAITAHGDTHVVCNADELQAATQTAYWSAWAQHADANGVWDQTPQRVEHHAAPDYGSRAAAALAFDAAGNGFAAFPNSVMRYEAATGTWAASAPDNIDSFEGAPVSLAVNPQGQALIAWNHSPSFNPDDEEELQASHYDGTWSPPVVISSSVSPLGSAPASSVWTGKSFIVAWSQLAPTGKATVFANEYTTTWTGSLVISDGYHDSSAPVIASDGRGNALTVWVQASNVAMTHFLDDMMFSRLPAATGRWSMPDRLSALQTDPESQYVSFVAPELVSLADGSALAVWQDEQSTAIADFVQNAFR